MRNQPNHLVTFVFHDQVNNITALLDMIDGYTASIGYPLFINTTVSTCLEEVETMS